MPIWQAVSLVIFGAVLLRIVYVAIARHYQNRAWPSHNPSSRKIDRLEINRIEREYGKDREER